jgi:ABC-type transport system substrate-binding protein
MKPYAFDPAKAKQLLADAGYPAGFEFEWTTSQNESWGLPIVEAVIPMLDKVGIKVKVKQVETAVLAVVVRRATSRPMSIPRPAARIPWRPLNVTTRRRRNRPATTRASRTWTSTS